MDGREKNENDEIRSVSLQHAIHHVHTCFTYMKKAAQLIRNDVFIFFFFLEESK